MTAPWTGTRDRIAPPSITVDPGYHVGICVRVENRAVNYGTIAPDDDPAITYRRDPRKHGHWHKLLDQHVARVLSIVDQLADVYSHLADDGEDEGRWTYAVEQFEGVPSFEAVVTRRLADVLTGELRAIPVIPRPAGALYSPKKAPVEGARMLDCYPPGLILRRGKHGEAAEDGRAVGLVPNHHPDRKRVHEQAAFDIAWYAYADPNRECDPWWAWDPTLAWTPGELVAA